MSREHRPSELTPARAAVPVGALIWGVLAAAVPALGSARAGAESPPDLRLEWLVDGEAVTAGAPSVRGREGATVEIPYRLRNVGGADAFAAVLEARTALGPAGRAVRLQPGPAAGAAVERVLRLAVAAGMRELCIDARLQTLEPDQPHDPNRHDNRICRPVEATKAGDSRDTAAPTRAAGLEEAR
jgi:hypothetical protein